MADNYTEIRFFMALLIAQSLLQLRLKSQKDWREREMERTDGECRRPGRRTLHSNTARVLEEHPMVPSGCEPLHYLWQGCGLFS